jgi:dihydroxy-acid dehydratase
MEGKNRSRVFSDPDPLSCIRRSMLYACGLTYEEIKRPLVAVVNTFNEMHPGHMHLRTLAERVKAGVRTGGGLPLEFSVLALCDGFANGNEGMKYVLPSRQVIADSIELGLQAHRYDAAVLVGSCDKIIPALLMAAVRVDIPSIIVTGGPMPPGNWARRGLQSSVSLMETFGKELMSGEFPEAIREEALMSFYPCAGACWGMGTANTMACLSEALGLALPGDSTAAAPLAAKARLGEQAGEKIMELVRAGVTPSQIVTEAALENALKVNAAIGGSLNTVLHLPALAHELGMQIGLDDFDRIARETPHLTNVEPAGPHLVVDLGEAGGIPAVMKMLGDRLDGSALTVTGETLSKTMDSAEVFDSEIIRSLDRPIHPYGGIAVLKGNLAEEGAVIKQVAVSEELRRFAGPAKVFNSEEEALAGLGGRIQPGDVIVIRYEGPKGGPGMREMAMFRAVLKAFGLGQSNYIVTDGRFSGYSEGPSIGYLSPEAAAGGTIALVEDGDTIEIDVDKRSIHLKVDQATLQARRKNLVPPPREKPVGYLERFAHLVTSAARGSVYEVQSDAE